MHLILFVQHMPGQRIALLAEYRQDERELLIEADTAHAYHLFYDYDKENRLIRWHDKD